MSTTKGIPPAPSSEDKRCADRWRAHVAARRRSIKLQHSVSHVEDAIASMTSLKNAECQRLRTALRGCGADMSAVQCVVDARLASLPAPPRPFAPDDVRMHALAAFAGVPAPSSSECGDDAKAAAAEARAEAEAGVRHIGNGGNDAVLRAALNVSEQRISLIGQRMDAEIDMLTVQLLSRQQRVLKSDSTVSTPMSEGARKSTRKPKAFLSDVTNVTRPPAASRQAGAAPATPPPATAQPPAGSAGPQSQSRSRSQSQSQSQSQRRLRAVLGMPRSLPPASAGLRSRARARLDARARGRAGVVATATTPPATPAAAAPDTTGGAVSTGALAALGASGARPVQSGATMSFPLYHDAAEPPSPAPSAHGPGGAADHASAQRAEHAITTGNSSAANTHPPTAATSAATPGSCVHMLGGSTPPPTLTPQLHSPLAVLRAGELSTVVGVLKAQLETMAHTLEAVGSTLVALKHEGDAMREALAKCDVECTCGAAERNCPAAKFAVHSAFTDRSTDDSSCGRDTPTIY